MTTICSTCGKKFSTSSNLLRHRATHADRDLHVCVYCRQHFLRSDTARRHGRICKSRNELPLPRAKLAGRRRTACDHCAETKQSCDTQQPCETCLKTDIHCSYSRLQTTENPPTSPRNLQIESRPRSEVTYGEARRGEALERFECNDAAYPIETASTPSLRKSLRDDPGVRFGRAIQLFPITKEASVSVLNNDSPNSDQKDSIEIAQLHTNQLVTPFLSPESAKVQREQLLQYRLRELASEMVSAQQAILKRTAKVCEIDQDRVQALFTAANFKIAIDAVFRRSYPHFPLVHRPTFDANSCTLPLLLTIFLAGCLYSYPSKLYDSAVDIDCVNLYEEYVFSDKGILSMGSLWDIHGSFQRQQCVEILIAAVEVTYLQLGSADAGVRWRMHHQRLPTIIEAARSIGLFQSIHHRDRLAETDHAWRIWAEEEMAIRTASYIFFLSCELATFYRVPPQLAIAEMRSGFPSTETLFAAASVGMWYTEILQTPGAETHSVRTTTSILMDADHVTAQKELANALSIYGFLLALCALHHIIFVNHASCTLPYIETSIKKALRTWKSVWDSILVDSYTSGENINEIHYQKFGTHFYGLAQSLLASGAESPERVAVVNLAEIHELLDIT